LPAEITIDRREGGVAVLSLNAPERRNALTVAMAEELVAACEELDRDREVGAVVVRGEGGFFCAGGDRGTLEAAGQDPADPEVYAGLGAVYRSFARVGELEAPTVAAVRGGAVGAGLNLMLATDLRIVAHDA
jgi:enoyl-CoA hydratase